MLDAVPEKLNPVIRPLMDCIKKEENVHLQVRAIPLFKVERPPNFTNGSIYVKQNGCLTAFFRGD